MEFCRDANVKSYFAIDKVYSVARFHLPWRKFMVEEIDVIDFLKDHGGQATLNDIALSLIHI